MRPFEEYLYRQEQESRAQWEDTVRKRRTREQEAQHRRMQFWWWVAVLAWVLICVCLWSKVTRTLNEKAFADQEPVVEETIGTPETETTAYTLEASLVTGEPAPEEPEDFENEKIEAALLETGYFRDDVPLDFETQAYLRAACEESGIEYELALAIIWKETTFRNVEGDSGESYGYMQIQPRWHHARMERLGVTDLMDPFSNFRVGCDYLAELLEKYPLAEALTYYNSGSPGQSRYAEDVIGYMEGLR